MYIRRLFSIPFHHVFKDNHRHHRNRDDTPTGIKDVSDLGVLIKDEKQKEMFTAHKSPACFALSTQAKAHKWGFNLQSNDVLTVDLTDLMVREESVSCR